MLHIKSSIQYSTIGSVREQPLQKLAVGKKGTEMLLVFVIFIVIQYYLPPKAEKIGQYV